MRTGVSNQVFYSIPVCCIMYAHPVCDRISVCIGNYKTFLQNFTCKAVACFYHRFFQCVPTAHGHMQRTKFYKFS